MVRQAGTMKLEEEDVGGGVGVEHFNWCRGSGGQQNSKGLWRGQRYRVSDDVDLYFVADRRILQQ